MAATLIYLLQKHYPNKNKIFFNDHWRTYSTFYSQATRVSILRPKFISLTFNYYKLQTIKNTMLAYCLILEFLQQVSWKPIIRFKVFNLGVSSPQKACSNQSSFYTLVRRKTNDDTLHTV
jgi:hypothetical protein